MAIIPFARLVVGTGRLAAAEGVISGLVNATLDSFCQDSDDFEEWEALERGGLEGAVARRVSPLTRALRNQYCPNSPPPRQPLGLQPAQYGVGGDSQGTVQGYHYRVETDGTITKFATRSETWLCGSNRGLPISPVREIPGASAGQFVNSIRLRRADGSEYEQSVSGTANTASNNRNYVVEIVDIRPCDGSIIPIIPPGVELVPPPIGTPAPIRPTFPINITLPQLPGLPPIVVPVVYAPITPTLELSPRISLRPNIQLPGFPDFAPDIDLDLGGISIGGGGDVTINDIQDIVNNSGDTVICPDPCEPVDYDQIRTIVFEELDSKTPPKRPTTPGSFTTSAANSATITLPPFTVSVTLQMVEPGISVPDQFGGENAPNVVFNGWYSYGVEEETSERIPFNYDFVSVPIPPNVRFFSYTITRQGTASATVRHVIPSP